MVKETLVIIMSSSFGSQLTSVKIDGGCCGAAEIECVKCECCGLTEECTLTYIATVRETNHGRWICGLCTEAVKDEKERSCSDSEEDALNRHMRFCKNFVNSPAPTNQTEDLISAVKHLLIRSLESPRSPRSSSGDGDDQHEHVESRGLSTSRLSF